jgi:hypothetical protein
MTTNLNQIILEEVRALRTRFDVHSADTGERLAILETHISSLVGDLQPGRMTILEASVKELSKWRWKMVGYCAGISGTVSTTAVILFHYLK